MPQTFKASHSILYIFLFVTLVSITKGCKNPPPTFEANNKVDPTTSLFQPPVPFDLAITTIYSPEPNLELSWKMEDDSLIFMTGFKIYKSISDTTFQLIASGNERKFIYALSGSLTHYTYQDTVPFETPWATFKIQSFYTYNSIDTSYSESMFVTVGEKPSDTLITITDTHVLISPFVEVPTAEFEWNHSDLGNKDVSIQIFKNLSGKPTKQIHEGPLSDKKFTYILDLEEDNGAIYTYRYSIKEGNDFNSKKETFPKGYYNSNVNVIVTESISETEVQIKFDWFTPQNSNVADTNPCYYDYLIAELYEGDENGTPPDTSSILLLNKNFEEETKSFNVEDLDSSRQYLIRTKVFRGNFKSGFLERTMFFDSGEWTIDPL